MKDTRVRFAPSPTGYLHIGGLRTALYDFLFARATGGKFVLRIEDTDRSRLVEDATEKLIKALQRVGIEPDEGPGIGGDYGPYIQSERLDLYHREAQRLLKAGHAYHCFCSSDTLTQMRQEQQDKGQFVKYDRRCLSLSKDEVEAKLAAGEAHVIRLKMPDERVFVIEDAIRGTVEMDSSQSDDQVIIKSDGFPTYHLAAVVDDHYMKISHVIRGEEWLSSTPKHIWLYECLGWDAPIWVHLPLILNKDRSKLSKRMNDVSVDSYLEKGYLREALINFIALLGWHSADDREIYSLKELCEVFSLDRVNKAGAVFDLAKLDWMNAQYLRSLPEEVILKRAEPFFEAAGYRLEHSDREKTLITVARERCTLLPELVEYARAFFERLAPDTKGMQVLQSDGAHQVVNLFYQALQSHWDSSKERVDRLLEEIKDSTGAKGKALFAPLRIALIRKEHGPDLPSTLVILGKDESLLRLQEALSFAEDTLS